MKIEIGEENFHMILMILRDYLFKNYLLHAEQDDFLKQTEKITEKRLHEICVHYPGYYQEALKILNILKILTKELKNEKPKDLE